MAVNYFLHLGILAKLKAEGFKSIISSRMESEIDQLISYERISGKAKNVIERIRSAVSSRIKSGKIKVGRLANVDPSVDRSISEHPTAALFHVAKYCDAIITDDRYLNQRAYFGDGDAPKPIFSTLDIIDMLVSMDYLTSEERLDCKTRLRRAGFIFVPIDENELAHHLKASLVKDGKVVETAELKAIRENILRVRMTTWLQLPNESPWLLGLLRTFVQVLRDLWKSGENFSEIRTRSNWILGQVDIRGWTHRFDRETSDHIVRAGRGVHIMLMLIPPTDVPQNVKNEYWNWLEEGVLAPIKKQYPDLYSWIVEEQRKVIANTANLDITRRIGLDE